MKSIPTVPVSPVSVENANVPARNTLRLVFLVVPGIPGSVPGRSLKI